MEMKCTTCNADISTVKGSVRFPCPKCGEGTIIRCGKCRQGVKGWQCEECGFEGP